MDDKELYNPLYRFLTEPKFMWYRHIVFIISIGIILANHIFITYEGEAENINIYRIIANYMLVYLFILYLNLYQFIPKLLLNRKYIQYSVLLLGMMLLFSFGDIYAEFHIHKYYQIPFGEYSFFSPERNRLVDLLSGFFIFTLYLVSVSAIDFYKHWSVNAHKVKQLETEQLNSELENLKSRISTEFLLNKLHKAAGLCRTVPGKASKILLQLSRVLRYQLYDCSRETVLLNSEIKYLNDYLTLEKICNENLEFKIVSQRTITNCFIPPLLLISIVEESLRNLSGRDDTIWIHLEFQEEDEILVFSCTDNRYFTEKQEPDESYLAIAKRLDLLGSEKYELIRTSDKGLNQYKVVLHYKYKVNTHE